MEAYLQKKMQEIRDDLGILVTSVHLNRQVIVLIKLRIGHTRMAHGLMMAKVTYCENAKTHEHVVERRSILRPKMYVLVFSIYAEKCIGGGGVMQTASAVS